MFTYLEFHPNFDFPLVPEGKAFINEWGLKEAIKWRLVLEMIEAFNNKDVVDAFLHQEIIESI